MEHHRVSRLYGGRSTFFKVVLLLLTLRSGDIGASQKVDGFEGACHKRFRTEAQAQAFIEDWNESYAQVVYREVKKGLDRGLQPRNMKPNVDGILISRDNECDLENVVEKFRTGLRVS
jgi:viroplasmin and RNaseH domain-containing protein